MCRLVSAFPFCFFGLAFAVYSLQTRRCASLSFSFACTLLWHNHVLPGLVAPQTMVVPKLSARRLSLVSSPVTSRCHQPLFVALPSAFFFFFFFFFALFFLTFFRPLVFERLVCAWFFGPCEHMTRTARPPPTHHLLQRLPHSVSLCVCFVLQSIPRQSFFVVVVVPTSKDSLA